MRERTIRLIDPTGRTVATVRATDDGGCYGGTIDLSATPPDLRTLFDQFEEFVNDQAFGAADAVEAKIEAVGLKAAFDDGTETRVTDLEVYPKTYAVAFKLAGAPVLNGTGPMRPSGRG